ncbi:MAG TPA: hypothetical protein VL306_01955 [Methylomirabilota bacterium]|jgi:hypothetical protein|nr:hypothetical protein [Methylomirabilota bacterium]
MLAQLLSSKPKTKLVNLFLAHPQRSFTFTELRVSTECSSPILKDALKELYKLEFLVVSLKNKIKYYQMNRHFALYPELVNLLRKVKNVPDDLLVRAASKLRECKLIVLTGVFVGKPRIETDLLLVGKVSPARLNNFLRMAEKFAEQEISYTIFTPAEFDYRKIMNDRFLKNILENNPIIVLDKIKRKTLTKVVYKS